MGLGNEDSFIGIERPRSSVKQRLRMFVHFSSNHNGRVIDESVAVFPFTERKNNVLFISWISLVRQFMALSSKKTLLKEAFSWWLDQKLVFELTQKDNQYFISRRNGSTRSFFYLGMDHIFSFPKKLTDKPLAISDKRILWVHKSKEERKERISFTFHLI